jgi:hypothetical protein
MMETNMRDMKNLKAVLFSLIIITTALTANCKANIRETSNRSTKPPIAADNVSDITPASNMNVPRSSHTATLLTSGQVLVAGGMERNGVIFKSAELYNSSNEKFTPTNRNMTTQRVGHTATLLLNGKVLLIGGWDEKGVLASAEIYDPNTETFTLTGSMSIGRGDFTATLLPSGKVLVAGGENDRALSRAEIYDPATGKFTPTGNMNAERTMHTAVLLPDGKVLIAGGGGYQHPLASAELYDPMKGTFTATGSMNFPRYKQAATLLNDGNILIVGGSDGRDWQGRYASVELYNPAKGTFSTIGNMNTARFKLPEAVVLLKNGKVLIAGGGEQVEVYNSTSRTFSLSAGRMDTARFYSTATLLSDGRVLVVGGYDNHSQASAKAWVYKT